MSDDNIRGPLYYIVSFALRFRGVVVALATLFLIYGVYAFRDAKYDVFPEFAPPRVTIETEAPGLAPEQVEVLITQPVENALNGVSGLASLRSTSLQGVSVVKTTFQRSADPYRIRQAVAERLSTLSGRLPLGASAPAMSPLTSSTGNVMAVGLTSTRLSLTALRTLADWTVKPRLLRVPGVANVAIFGGTVRQLQVQVRRARLIHYGLSLDDILASARRLTGIRGAGFIDTPNQRIVLQTEGQSLDAAALARAPIVKNGAGGLLLNLRLGDVAEVREGTAPPISAAAVMGQPGVVLNLSSQYGANTLEVTRRLDAALRELAPALAAQGATLHPDLFRAASFIQVATHNMRSSLLLGAALIVVVLFLFLYNLRAAAISCAVIPLSLLAGTTVLDHLGYSLNTMSLGGLAISIGLLVDDAVITVENVFRRLRENRQADAPRPVGRVILDASLEVRSAVVYATLVVALVFVPVLTLPGVAGRLFAPLGIAYILATLASLLAALTLTPALCSLLLTHTDIAAHESPVVRFLKARYLGTLTRIERHPRVLIAFLATLALVALVAAPFLHAGFLPALKEGHFIVHMSAVPGTSLEQSLRLGGRVTRALLADDPEVGTVAQRAGRASASDVLGTQSSEFDVSMKPLSGNEAEGAANRLRRLLTRFVGASFSVNSFLTERIQETISGYTAAVVVNLYADNLDALDKSAQDIARVLNNIPGASDVQVQSPPGTPQLLIRLRPRALARWGFDAVTVLDAVRTAYQGAVVGQMYQGNRVFNLAVTLAPDERDVAGVAHLPLRNAAGLTVRLGELADIRQVAGRYAVLHEGAQRVQTVTCNVVGRNLNDFVAAAQRAIQTQVRLPPGGYIQFGGTAREQARSQRDLLLHALLAGVAVVLLLSMIVKSGRNLALLLVNLPFALVGGVIAALAGGGLTLGALVGFVTLFGITLRNAMMMIAHWERMVYVEGAPWGAETARRGALERLTPILMTALVTSLGLLPLALGAGAPGREIEGPMAIVILGGLATSTLLNLLALPALALRYGRFTAPPGNDAAPE
ncbi:MAG: efflux RND transporter permease subunit [Sulfuricaulis sp.]